MFNLKKKEILNKLLFYHNEAKELLNLIDFYIQDKEINSNEKLSEIKKIQEKLIKVKSEIDIIEKEITLYGGRTDNFNIN